MDDEEGVEIHIKVKKEEYDEFFNELELAIEDDLKDGGSPATYIEWVLDALVEHFNVYIE